MNLITHIADLRERLQRCQATNEQVSAAAGGAVSDSWVSKFRCGHMDNPRAQSLVALDSALRALDCQRGPNDQQERAA